MADSESLSALKITRGDKIIVTVESAIPDIIVVSYIEGNHSFQGALLNLNKRGLPCGITPPDNDPDGDSKLPLASRYTYYQEKKGGANQNNKIPAKVDVKRNINRISKYKNARPTVRLRPRQVLCNKCRSICNEKNENVDASKKRKNNPSENESGGDTLVRRRSERRNPHRNHLEEKVVDVGAIKINPIDNEDKSSSSGQLSWEDSKSNESLMKNIEPSESSDPDENLNGIYRATPRRLSSSSIESAKIPDDEINLERKLNDGKVKGRTSRKKRSVGSMEDLWDETVFEDMMKSSTRTTPIIKISFGAQGEGTVLKIPLKIDKTFDKNINGIESSTEIDQDQDLDDDDDDVNNVNDESTEMERHFYDDNKKCDKIDDDNEITDYINKWELTDEKISKRSFKKTRKIDKCDNDNVDYDYCNSSSSNKLEINENIQLKLKLNTDISYEMENAVDNVNKIKNNNINIDKLINNKNEWNLSAEKAAKKALKKAKKGTRRKILNGNISPRYSTSYDQTLIYHQHRKRKEKHKKKHKDDRKQHKNHQQITTDLPTPITTINHKEIHGFQNGESYSAIKEQCLKQKLSISLKRLNTNAYARCDYSNNTTSECKSSGISSEEHSENEIEQQTNFTSQPAHSLAMRLTATSVEHCLTATGRRMDVGDIVWGKIHGFPWWPGKVLSLSVPCKEDGTSADVQAHVAWYGSSTCSLMSCDRLSPFLETFKARYNKKKRGPYKEAIRQAQSEARNQTSTNETTDILNVCQSPRQVDVIS